MKLDILYKDGYIFVVDSKNNNNIVETFAVERNKSVEIFGNFIFVTRNSGEQFLVDTVKDRNIEDFMKVKFLEKYSVIIIKYDEDDYRMICAKNCKQSSCFENFEIRKDGKMILHFHDRDIEFDPETGEEVPSKIIGKKELQKRATSWAGKKKPALL